MLEPGDFGIGRALDGLAKTIEVVGKLEEVLDYAQQAINRRLEYEGPDAWWTNRKRLDLSRILQKRERSDQDAALLEELHNSIAGIEDRELDDQRLLAEAAERRASIQAHVNSEIE